MTGAYDVELLAVTRRFGGHPAVDDISLSVSRGEFLSLLGPSGCGKTTTLRLVAGFERCDAGRILIDGVDVTHRPPYRRDVNTVFQSYALFPHLSVIDNVTYGLKHRRVAAADRQRAGRDMLELVGLVGLEQRKPKLLSGGQQQRVALARALVMRPRVLLLDEPLGALDLEVRRKLQIELKRIQSDVGVTFIYVTHDQEEALAMSDRVAVINSGRIEQVGTPSEVYDNPATRFVARFIGETNFFEHSGQLLAVRPDLLLLSHADEHSRSPRSAAGRVRSVMLVGSVIKYIILDSNGQEVVVKKQRVEDSPARAIREGDDVVFSWTDQAVLNYQKGREKVNDQA